MARRTLALSSTRLLALMPWPAGFVCAVWDSASLLPQDWVLLSMLAAIGTCSAVTQRGWLRLLLAGTLFGAVVFSMFSLEPALRSAAFRHESARAYYLRIKPYRPYILVAAIGLFAAAVTSRPGARDPSNP